MGSSVSAAGITRDLEAMQAAGIGGATIFSLADTVTPWACTVGKSPAPEIVAFTEPWWALVRHAAEECRRLGLELILHNCAGYESSGGPWITPELSMQELIWAEHPVTGGGEVRLTLARPAVDLHPPSLFPDCHVAGDDPVTTPLVEARRSYYRDIAVVAMPAEGVAAREQVLDLSGLMPAEGELRWTAPKGEWTVYRFGHTTTGAMTQPAQREAMGLECDKMSREAVAFHVRHVLGEMRKHLGPEMGRGDGTGLTTLYFDSYEAGEVTWTAKMREEFYARRGYDLVAWLPVLAGRMVGSEAETEKFRRDFRRTVEDLYRDCYWATPGPLAHEAGLKFAAEPYEGPWEIAEVVKDLDIPAVEFWTTNNRYSPSNLEPVVRAARKAGQQLIVAEAFTSEAEFAAWTEHPAWLKPIGDAAFCAGVNRVNIHHMVQQAWDAKYQPGTAMGQWGIHLGRYQTWWKPGRAWLGYLGRCQTLLQRGEYVPPGPEASLQVETDSPDVPGVELHSIHRRDGNVEIYFLANVAWRAGAAQCFFPVKGRQPEVWDPVTDSVRDLPDFEVSPAGVRLALEFAETQSYFVVFRRPLSPKRDSAGKANFDRLEPLMEIEGSWRVRFDPRWGGPEEIEFKQLTDWTEHENAGVRYFSGTAVYEKEWEMPAAALGGRVFLELGVVKHIAEVTLNGKELGVVWTTPWRIEITGALREGKNLVEIAVSNVWANRLIGDEQFEPDVHWQQSDLKAKTGAFLTEYPEWFLKGGDRPVKERRTFTTWNYFAKDSPLTPSGLMGPVRVLVG